MSHTVGSEGFIPAILAFGTERILSNGEYTQLQQIAIKRLDLMNTVRREYEAIVTQLCIRRAMNAAKKKEIVTEFTPGDEVMIYS